MFRSTCLILATVVSVSTAAYAADLPTTSLQVQPAEITLNGPRGAQQLIVTANAEAATIHDATHVAEYKTDDAAVAVIENSVVIAKGNGTTTAKNGYQYLDKYPLSTRTYYRLQQLDVDGKKKPSNIISVERKGLTQSLKVYPNPSKDGLIFVEIVDGTDAINGGTDAINRDSTGITITNALGQILFQDKAKRQNQWQIDVSTWASAVYFVQSGGETIKFVKN